jgi:flagellar protein FlbD
MVELTKLNGGKLYLNENWIESVEAVPDTTITFNSGNKVVVLEKMELVLEKIIRWQASLRGEKAKLRPGVQRRR